MPQPVPGNPDLTNQSFLSSATAIRILPVSTAPLHRTTHESSALHPNATLYLSYKPAKPIDVCVSAATTLSSSVSLWTRYNSLYSAQRPYSNASLHDSQTNHHHPPYWS